MCLFLAELYKMVCEPDETALDIRIPAVMLPQDAGATLEKMLMNNSLGMLPYTQRTFITHKNLCFEIYWNFP